MWIGINSICQLFYLIGARSTIINTVCSLSNHSTVYIVGHDHLHYILIENEKIFIHIYLTTHTKRRRSVFNLATSGQCGKLARFIEYRNHKYVREILYKNQLFLSWFECERVCVWSVISSYILIEFLLIKALFPFLCCHLNGYQICSWSCLCELCCYCLILNRIKTNRKNFSLLTMDSGPALSSTPRKTIVKPVLRLSIPTPNAQFTSSPRSKNESNSSMHNVSQTSNNSSSANDSVCSVVDNSIDAETPPTNKNNQSEVEKLIKSERFAQPNKCRSDGSSTSPLANGFSKNTSQTDLDASDAGDDAACLPSYKSFESDFRRRIDEINAANRFDMRLKGKWISMLSLFFLLPFACLHVFNHLR